MDDQVVIDGFVSRLEARQRHVSRLERRLGKAKGVVRVQAQRIERLRQALAKSCGRRLEAERELEDATGEALRLRAQVEAEQAECKVLNQGRGQLVSLCMDLRTQLDEMRGSNDRLKAREKVNRKEIDELREQVAGFTFSGRLVRDALGLPENADTPTAVKRLVEREQRLADELNRRGGWEDAAGPDTTCPDETGYPDTDVFTSSGG